MEVESCVKVTGFFSASHNSSNKVQYAMQYQLLFIIIASVDMSTKPLSQPLAGFAAMQREVIYTQINQGMNVAFETPGFKFLQHEMAVVVVATMVVAE